MDKSTEVKRACVLFEGASAAQDVSDGSTCSWQDRLSIANTTCGHCFHESPKNSEASSSSVHVCGIAAPRNSGGQKDVASSTNDDTSAKRCYKVPHSVGNQSGVKTFATAEACADYCSRKGSSPYVLHVHTENLPGTKTTKIDLPGHRDSDKTSASSANGSPDVDSDESEEKTKAQSDVHQAGADCYTMRDNTFACVARPGGITASSVKLRAAKKTSDDAGSQAVSGRQKQTDELAAKLLPVPHSAQHRSPTMPNPREKSSKTVESLKSSWGQPFLGKKTNK